MKPLSFYLLICCLLLYVPSNAQAENYYSYQNGRIVVGMRSGITDTLIFHTDAKEDASVASGAVSLVLGILVPKLVENVPRLFYNPENYIKESLAAKSCLHHDGSHTRLGELHHIQYKKMAGEVPLAIFNFTIGDMFMEKGYLDISLESAKINETAVRLKPMYHDLNVVVEVFFHYYNAQQQKLVHAVEPFVLTDMATGPYHAPKDQKIRLIPKFELLERIDIKVTEVNARKKDWDAYLSFYKEHSGQLAGYLLGLIPQ